MLRRIAQAAASNPRIYEWIQVLLGREAAWRRIQPFVPPPGDRWLDIGSSTGSFPSLEQEDRQPACVDIDVQPLALRKQRNRDRDVVAADASALPFRDGSFDVITCFAMSHHLDDDTLSRAFAEAARVTRRSFLFFDAVRQDRRFLSRLLWRYDRGRFARPRTELRTMLTTHFEIAQEISYTVAHEYWVALCRTRR